MMPLEVPSTGGPLHYTTCTTDGTDPTVASPTYTGPFAINDTFIVKSAVSMTVGRARPRGGGGDGLEGTLAADTGNDG